MPGTTDEVKATLAAYLKQHQIQGTLNELVNSLLENKPLDPFLYMANFLDEKIENKVETIEKVVGREVFDSQGKPTVEVDVMVRDLKMGSLKVRARAGRSWTSAPQALLLFAHELVAARFIFAPSLTHSACNPRAWTDGGPQPSIHNGW